MVYGIFIVLLFCAIHCDFAVAATITTDGVESSLILQVVREPLLGRNTWTQNQIHSADRNPAVRTFYNWHVAYDFYYYPAGCGPLAVAQVMRFFEHPKTPPM